MSGSNQRWNGDNRPPVSLTPSTDSTMTNRASSNASPSKPHWLERGEANNSQRDRIEDLRQDEDDNRVIRDRLDRMGTIGVDKFLADDEAVARRGESNSRQKKSKPVKMRKQDRRGKAIYVNGNGTQAGTPTRTERDETPKANNRTTEKWEASARKAELRESEGIASTLATVVQKSGKSEFRYYTEPESTDYDDNMNHASSREVERQWEDINAKLQGQDDSSAEVDKRWDQLSQKLLKGFDSSKPAIEVLSDDISDHCRDNLLNVNSSMPLVVDHSESDAFEDELIQDCIETGLPSPTKDTQQQGGIHFDINSNIPMSLTIESQKSYPSSLPGMDLRQPKNVGTAACNRDNGPTTSNYAQIDTVASALTGEDESRHEVVGGSISSLSDIIAPKSGRGNSNILKQLSSGSNTEDDIQDQTELMKTLSLSSDSSSSVLVVKTHAETEQGRMFLPKRALEPGFEDEAPTPRIEVSLASSTSHSDSDSDYQAENFTEGEKLSVGAVDRHGRLLWWRKNGFKLVAKLNGKQSPMSMVDSSPRRKKASQIKDKDSPNNGAFRTASLFDGTSVGESSHDQSDESRSKTSFDKRRAMFENKADKQGKPDKRQQTELLDMGSMEKSRAPQPNPDAQSSNSRDFDRGNDRSEKIKKKASVASKREAYEQATKSTHEVDVRARARKFIATAKARTSRSSIVSSRDDATHARSQMEEAPPSRNAESLRSGSSSMPRVSTPTTGMVNTKVGSAWSKPRPTQCSAATASIKSKESGKTLRVVNLQSDHEGEEKASDSHIVSVASSLTGASTELIRPKEKGRARPAPILTKTNNEVDGVLELTVGYSSDRSFDTRLSNTSAGIPSWRLDADTSLADFVIDVTSTNSEVSSSFNVHKHILAVGPRKSETLETLFRSTGHSKTKLSMVDDAISLLPTVFDFVYCHDFEIELTTETVLGFRHLARLLKIVPLLVQTSKFLLNDLAISNMSTYISKADYYKDNVVRNLIAAKCGERLEKIDISDLLWGVMDPGLFFSVLSCPRIDREEMSSHLSLLIVEYQTLHKYEMDADLFESITSESVIPFIDHKAAIPLLEICEEYGAPVVFQPLQKRCAKVVAYNWQTTSDLDRKRLFALLRSLPSNFTVDFLEIVETGKAFSLIDSSSSTHKRTMNPDDYQGLETFTLARLCDNYPLHNLDNRPLSWRMDSVYTFSDWTIKVKHRDDGAMHVYHVHKHMLAIGHCRSNFFAEAFLSGDHSEVKRGTTVIELASAPAELVPTVLDFIYAPEHELEIETKTALALRFLARVLGIWMLNKEIMEFVQNDLDLENMLYYIEQSELYDDDKVIILAVHKCAMSINGIAPDSDLLRGLKPDFFGRVIASPHIDKNVSCHVNILIAKFFTLKNVEESYLADLMKLVPMKDIDSNSALQLLEVLSVVTSNGPEVFEDVRRRCGAVLVENWKEIREENRALAFRIFRSLDSSLVTDLFDAIEQDYYAEHIDNMTIQSKLVKRYRGQLADAKLQRETELSQLRDEMHQKIAIMLEKQQELEEEISTYKDATSRRALRSNGGFAHSRIPSPRKSIGTTSPRKSLIPRLSTGAKGVQAAAKNVTDACTSDDQVLVVTSPKSEASTPVVRNSGGHPQLPVATPPPGPELTRQSKPLTAVATKSTPSETASHTPSLFGRMFHCGPTDTEEPANISSSSSNNNNNNTIRVSAETFEARLAAESARTGRSTPTVRTSFSAGSRDGTSLYNL